ncbi:MAG: hypothetical protein JSS66_05765 [Armatimonadetes bacterium]|nr:hypothetical protein [Armatimonadota bacterium]
MTDYNQLKKTKFDYEPKNGTVTITGVPFRFFRSVLTAASLHNHISGKASKLEHTLQPSERTQEACTWHEGERRAINCFTAMMEEAVFGDKSSVYEKKEADSAALAQWATDQENYAKLLEEQQAPLRAEPLTEPDLSAYRARLTMLELLKEIGYTSSSVTRIGRGTSDGNTLPFALEHLAKVPALLKELQGHLEKYNAALPPPGKPTDDTQPLERVFG